MLGVTERMADLPIGFWAGWVGVLTVVGLVALGWLTFSVYFASPPDPEESESAVWDENLREGSVAPPLWWFWMILSLLVFSVIYLMLYPGLGGYAGALKWSQSGRLADSMAAYETRFSEVRDQIAKASIKEIQADASLMKSAQRVFDRNCVVCHGYDARGQASLFPDLRDKAWQWGGSAEQIEQSIRAGRTGAMIPWLQVLGEDDVKHVADYVIQLKEGNVEANQERHPGQVQYNQFCVACHGVDGTGNELLGAPSFIDGSFLYGSSAEAVEHSIAMGRNGQMPSFGDRLDDTQIRLLVALLIQEP